jgi:hypothetical protein
MLMSRTSADSVSLGFEWRTDETRLGVKQGSHLEVRHALFTSIAIIIRKKMTAKDRICDQQLQWQSQRQSGDQLRYLYQVH